MSIGQEFLPTPDVVGQTDRRAELHPFVWTQKSPKKLKRRDGLGLTEPSRLSLGGAPIISESGS